MYGKNTLHKLQECFQQYKENNTTYSRLFKKFMKEINPAVEEYVRYSFLCSLLSKLPLLFFIRYALSI